jgi:hypothetical protein
MDMAEQVALIEKNGFQTPADAALVFQWLKVLNEERMGAFKRIVALEANAVTICKTFVEVAGRLERIEGQLASVQRLSATTN